MRRAVVTGLPSEAHTWGFVYLQLLLEEEGFGTRVLPSCTPFEVILRTCLEFEPDLVVISSTNGHGAFEGRSFIRDLRHAVPEFGGKIVIGGMLSNTLLPDERIARTLLQDGFDGVFLGDNGLDSFLRLVRAVRPTESLSTPSTVARDPHVSRSGSSQSTNWPRMLGIVGGVGPHAHVALEQRLLRIAVKSDPARLEDQEYPPWFVINIPQTPDRTSALIGDGASPVPRLLESLRKLRTAGCDFALIACNAAHSFFDELDRSSPLPLLNMVRETLRYAARLHGESATLGILGSSGILARGTYQRVANEVEPGLRILTPLDLGGSGEQIQRDCVMGSIFGGTVRIPIGIKSGGHQSSEGLRSIRAGLASAVSLLSDAGADAVLLSCTEFPLVLGELGSCGVPLVDCLEASARAAIEVAAGRRSLPRRVGMAQPSQRAPARRLDPARQAEGRSSQLEARGLRGF